MKMIDVVLVALWPLGSAALIAAAHLSGIARGICTLVGALMVAFQLAALVVKTIANIKAVNRRG